MFLSSQSTSIPLLLCSRQLQFQYLSPTPNFICSTILYKWCHLVHILLHLFFFTEHVCFEIHPGYYVLLPFVLLNNISLYEYATVFLSIFHWWKFRLFPVVSYYAQKMNGKMKFFCRSFHRHMFLLFLSI